MVLTLVSDATSLKVYQNDELIQSINATGAASWNLERFDLSMTWDDGSSWPLKQAFNGYSAYARVWSRALSVSDITASLCEVPANAEGLEIEWKFDGATEKWIENSVTKNGDLVLDFTDCKDGNDHNVDNSDAAQAAWKPLTDFAGLCYNIQ